MKRHIFLSIATLLCAMSVPFHATAQEKAVNIRYVKTAADGGAYANDGTSWDKAKNNIQDAINSLVDEGLTGEVWVAAGTYTPTESTEKTGGSTLYMSFKVPAGITLRGGFAGDETSADDRVKEKYTQTINEQTVEQDWTYKNRTTLSGNLSTKAKFVWNATKQNWNTSFYGNCYHVVWFATNGFDAATGRANPLDTSRGEAVVEGFTIENGNARNSDLTGRFHNAYGGGAYMVWGSRLENCRVVNCEASRDGGGVYMDGGGLILHSYIANCQALGIGTQFGYGGGVCLDATGQPDRHGIYRSVIVGNVGRMGGGLAFKVENTVGTSGLNDIPAHYRAFASAVLVGNNTATTEGGGVYTLGGGAFNNLSVVNNRCNGSGITSHDMQTGRAGGMYCRDHALILNSVFWGNDCEANKDIQFAATKSSNAVENVILQFCALEKSDNVDWTNTAKLSVFTISERNKLTDGQTQTSANEIFPSFINPTTNAGYDEVLVSSTNPQSICWIPGANSGLANAGIVSLDLNIKGNLPFVSIPSDILGHTYNSRATLGAYTRRFGNMTPQKLTLCNNEGKVDNNTNIEAWHFFVDPNAPTGASYTTHGVSWDTPARFLGNVLHTIDSLRSVDNPAFNLGNQDNPDRVFVHVKEGTMNTTNSYATGRVRNISLAVPSNVVILGGYPEELTGTNLTETDANGTTYRRNPLCYPTYITGEIIADNYSMNAAHLFTLKTGVADVIIDGFNVRYANARSTLHENTRQYGGGIIMQGVNGVKVRNTIIAGCSANTGSAVYVEDGENVEFENCIFHNNEAFTDGAGVLENYKLGGIVYVGKRATTTTTTFKHCNILNNVGYGISLTEGAVQNWYNSVAFANMQYRYLYNKREVAYLPTKATDEEHTEFLKDYVAETFHRIGEADLKNLRIYNCFHDGKREKLDQEDETQYNATLLEYRLNVPGKYPRFVNGIVNAGVSLGGNRTFYGRAASFEPHNENPMVNAARAYAFNTDGSVQMNGGNPVEITDHTQWGTDMSTITTRDYGGLPDVGAIENHAESAASGEENAYVNGQQKYGSVIYVRTPETGGNDNNTGASWEQAVATVTHALEIAQEAQSEFVSTQKVKINAGQQLSSLEQMIAAGKLQIECSGRSSNVYWTNGSYSEGWDTYDNILIGSSDATDEATYFIFEMVDGSETDFYIKDRNGNYISSSIGNDTRMSIGGTNKQIFRLQKGAQERSFAIRNISTTSTYYYPNAYTETKIAGWTEADGNSSWYITNVEEFEFTENVYKSTPRSTIYVGAGTYTGTHELKDGVSILGGFPTTGNPGEVERNISNTDPKYTTILDAEGNGRVVYQKEEFDCPTTVEGFIIENGSTSGEVYGAGVYLQKNGIIKNCVIQKNTFTTDNTTPSDKGGAGVYITTGGTVKNSIIRYNKISANAHFRVCGAGIYSDGGEFQNSLIVENEIDNDGGNYILGAGAYISKKSYLYSCTIAYNIGKGVTKENQGSPPAATGGVWDAAAKWNDGTYSGGSEFYKCIIWGNAGYGKTDENYIQVGMTEFKKGGGGANNMLFDCYSSGIKSAEVSSTDRMSNFASDKYDDVTRVFMTKDLPDNGNRYASKEFVDAYVNECKANEPFKRDPITKLTDYSLDLTPKTVTEDFPNPIITAQYCINMGGDEQVLEDRNIFEDIVGADRVLDCTVDKGAYEYNAAYDIEPDITTVPGQAIFYVVPEGGKKIDGTSITKGNASANSPLNAACAQKLQSVLDAAGRYKYMYLNNTDTNDDNMRVIVKIGGYENKEKFTYYATRSTVETDTDVRIYSIMIPRGVEVWGGYNEAYTDENNNGFFTKTFDTNGNVTETKDNRSITGNPTYFNSQYYSSNLATNINTYHVVTFTDRVFDANGLPFLKGDKVSTTASSSYNPTTDFNPTFLSMNADGKVTDRAVVDGIYITGGRADVRTASAVAEAVNVNSYGGAAIVTDYAHVRNCIVRDNQGVYGGALALTHGALVTGCLIEENTADYGGAIYVFADKTKLSDGTTIETTNEDYDGKLQTNATRYDINMPQVLSSTIVNNRATVQGGGVWFTNNVRFNSVAVWQNLSQDQANVRGEYNVSRPDGEFYTTTEYYPFNYSAIQDVLPSGLNNISLEKQNKYGARFYSQTYLDWEKKNDGSAMPTNHVLAVEGTNEDDFSRLDDFSHFVPSDYSVLVHGGMPVSEYNEIVGKSLSPVDFLGESRTASPDHRSSIEIGALASDKEFAKEALMLRLYVARPENINPDAALAMRLAELNNTATTDSEEEKLIKYYSQEGSSFAYPFQKLQDALNYIYVARGLNGTDFDANKVVDGGNNMSFEIFLGGGTYYPTVDLTGLNNHTIANTFLVPEGVSLFGGFDPERACNAAGVVQTGDNHFFGAVAWADHNDPASGTGESWYNSGTYYLDKNRKNISINSIEIKGDGDKTYTLHHVNRFTAMGKREPADINANSVIEPWEFANQTVLSGKVEGQENEGVNHIVTVIADERFTGKLPTTLGAPEKTHPGGGGGYIPHEMGQTVAFNGLTFTGGYAYGYHPNSMDNNHKMKYNNGGAILVDGNRYLNSANGGSTTYEYKNGDKISTVGYRDIPIVINRCKFEDNMAGFGGAISTNTTVEIVNSSFEHNRAWGGVDTVDYVKPTITAPTKGETVSLYVRYPGAGGAIYSTYQLTAVNTMFENNEAVDSDNEGLHQYSILSDLIYTANNTTTYTTEAINNDVTKRQMIAGSGGAVMMARKSQFHFLNCNFVRNAANAYPAIFTVNPNYKSQETDENVGFSNYNQALNCVFWGNEITDKVKAMPAAELNKDYNTANRIPAFDEIDKEKYLWGINKIVNYGPANRNGANYQIGVHEGYHAWDQATLDKEENYTGTVWFSAYEAGKGRTQVNKVDLRDMLYTPLKHIRTQIATELEDEKYKDSGVDYQNCNIVIASTNVVTEGPNFVNPSTKAGYDGYMESADWSPARTNRLTDSGWGRIKQKINTNGSAEFLKYESAADLPTTPTGRTGTGGYSTETIGDYQVEGAYSTIRYQVAMRQLRNAMPIGEQEYMYSSSVDTDGKPAINYYRISHDPNPTHNQTYIDMGVYEYYHAPLTPSTEGDEVDVLWVSALEKDGAIADGKTWATPTSDLQRAIETLLSSRNDHRKEIRLLDGTFVPIYTIEGHLGFYINTFYQNGSVVTGESSDPSVITSEIGKGVQSLTIKGGYSSELANARDVDEYPAIIRQQLRTDANKDNHRWDHLFLIKDPTQRYAQGNYSNTNGYGHIYSDKTGITTIPIEFDGVTLINDQATPGTVGSVIHYAPLTDSLTTANANDAYTSIDDSYKITPGETSVTVKPEDGKADYHYWTKTVPAKIVLSKTKIYGSGVTTTNGFTETDLEGVGVTTANAPSAVYLGDAQGGHAVLYNNVMHSNYVNPLVSGAKTLTVNNTFALNAGKVWLDAEESTIHNSVFWKNNPTTTEGQYGAQFLLKGFGTSGLSNVENPSNITNIANILSYNAYTNSDSSNGLTNSTDYTSEVSKYAYNVALYSDNANFMLGPNFTNPEATNLEDRDFTLLPSLRLMNRGLDLNYDTLKVTLKGTLPTPGEGKTTGVELTTTNTTDLQVKGGLLDLAYNTTYDEDAATNPRFKNTIDLGAYEYQKEMRRVLYVDPNGLSKDDKAGESWENSIGMGGLQDAIDLAALYHASNTSGEQAFVFVRGTTQLGLNPANQVHTGEEVILRNGVTILGGIRPSFVQTCVTKTEGTSVKHEDDDIKNYLALLEEDSEGYVGPNTQRTAITGIKTNSYTVFDATKDAADTDRQMRIQSYIMGFHVTPVDTSVAVTAPIIDIDPQVGTGYDVKDAKVALSHITVYDNKVANNEPLARMKNSLIYGAMFRDNATKADADGKNAAVLRLDEGGYAASVSVQGATESEVGDAYVRKYNGHGTNGVDYEKTTRIFNSIVNYDKNDPEYTLASDLKDATGTVTDTLVTAQTRYTLTAHNYRGDDRNLYFQLTEGSKHINEIEVVKGATHTAAMTATDGMPANLRTFINYQTDRDLLGNPRLLTLTDKKRDNTALSDGMELLDRGAYETWKVEKDTWTHEHDHGTEGDSDAAHDHFTPHAGSVVYIAEGKNLILGAEFQPGFLLLKDGASLYGNGNNVKVAFVAVEREIDPNGSVVSMPFEMDYSQGATFSDGIARSFYVGADSKATHDMNGILNLVYDEDTEVYDYDPEDRSGTGYDFSPTSGAWKELSTQRNITTKEANQGVLIVPDPAIVAQMTTLEPYKSTGKLIYSFTSQGASWYNNVYTENEDEQFKEVKLTQNDDRESTNGGADFTSKENMGWNLIGLPYLVSEYKTHETDYAQKELGTSYTSNIYNMDIPHELWLYYDGKTDADGEFIAPDNTAAEGDGGFYKVDSWSANNADWHLASGETPRIWVGEGIFTQTASVTGKEVLKFYRPVAPTETSTAKEHGVNPAPRRNTRYYAGEEAIEDRMELDLDIRVRQRTVTISGLKGGENIAIYDTTGRLYVRGTASTAPEDSVIGTQYSTTLSAGGVYIIAVDGTRKKVAVK